MPHDEAHPQYEKRQEHIKLPFNPYRPEWAVDLLIRDAAGLVKKTEKQPEFGPVRRLQVLPLGNQNQQEQADIIRGNDTKYTPQVEMACQRPGRLWMEQSFSIWHEEQEARKYEE